MLDGVCGNHRWSRVKDPYCSLNTSLLDLPEVTSKFPNFGWVIIVDVEERGEAVSEGPLVVLTVSPVGVRRELLAYHQLLQVEVGGLVESTTARREVLHGLGEVEQRHLVAVCAGGGINQ